jgi:Glycosyltransferase family 87
MQILSPRADRQTSTMFPIRHCGYLIAAAAMAVFVTAALLLGQDMNWDLRNYHYYDGWAVFHENASRNLWPAQIQTFHNPAFAAVVYLLIAHLPPYAASICLAAVQSLNVPLLALIAFQTFGRDDAARLVAVTSAVLIGATGPVMRTEIGTTLGDNVASLGVLAAVASIGRFELDRSDRWLVAAGLAAGAAAGLKLPNAIYVLGIAISGWWIGGGVARMLCRSTVFACSSTLGFLIVYGCWGWHLWATTGNPVFPYFNSIFHSPLASLQDFRDQRFLPGSLLDALSYPLQWAIGRFPTGELPFRDIRFAVGWLLVPFAVWAFFAGGLSNVGGRRFRTLLLFWISSFSAWLVLFSYQRFALPLELLSGIVIVGCVVFLPRLAERSKAVIAVVAAVVTIAATRAQGYDRSTWRDDWFGVELSADLARDNQMMIMLSHEPLAYVVPFLPATTRFVRLEGNLVLVPGTGLHKMAQSAIALHHGSFATLAPAYPSRAQADLMTRFGLVLAPAPCAVITTVMERLLSCPLTRSPATSDPGSRKG